MKLAKEHFCTLSLPLDAMARTIYFSLCTFFTQSELIEPVSPQAAQLGIHYIAFTTQLEMHLLEGPD